MTLSRAELMAAHAQLDAIRQVIPRRQQGLVGMVKVSQVDNVIRVMHDHLEAAQTSITFLLGVVALDAGDDDPEELPSWMPREQGDERDA